jgi:ABC-type multidrug transport system fused ATPase/permease subunit
VINDVAVINDFLTQGMITLVGDMLVLLGIIVVMLTMSPRLALLTFIVIPIMALVNLSVLDRKPGKPSGRQDCALAALVGRLAENIDGMRVIQAFAQEERIEKRFYKVNQAHRDANVQAIRLSYIFLPSIEFLATLAMAIVLWYGGRLVAGGRSRWVYWWRSWHM